MALENKETPVKVGLYKYLTNSSEKPNKVKQFAHKKYGKYILK